MCFDYCKLLGRLREKGITQKELAKKIENTPATLSLKLNNKASFKTSEISTICQELEIPALEIGEYFFYN